MITVKIESLTFPSDEIPHIADVHYVLKGNVSELHGHMRIGVPGEFIDTITAEVTEILRSQIKEIKPCLP
jgi:hypothetical protein